MHTRSDKIDHKNTMHLHCIGIVLMMGIALIKEKLLPRPISDDSGKRPEVVFIKTAVATTARDHKVNSRQCRPNVSGR